MNHSYITLYCRSPYIGWFFKTFEVRSLCEIRKKLLYLQFVLVDKLKNGDNIPEN